MIPSIAQLRNVTAMTILVEQMIDAPLGQERMACFYGPSGWGKTSAVGVAEVTFDAIAIEVPESVTKRFFLKKICEIMSLTPRGSIPDLVELIAAELARSTTPLIIDDAQYLLKSNDMIGLARDIYNGAGRVAPVILVGEEELPRKLTAIENIHNRVSAWEGAQPCEMSDARQLAQIYAPGIEIEEALLVEIVQAADGSVRRVNNNLLAVCEVARSNGTNQVDLTLWGKRSFFDGKVPPKRTVENLRPKLQLAQTTRGKRVATR